MNDIAKDGIKLTKLNFNSVGHQIQELLNHGEYRLILKPWRNKRSLSQNNLSHMWYEEISKYLMRSGRSFATPDWVKASMKHTYLGYMDVERVDVITGEVTTVRELVHTSSLDTGAMHYFMSQVEAWAASIGCLVTIPGDSEYKRIKEKQDE